MLSFLQIFDDPNERKQYLGLSILRSCRGLNIIINKFPFKVLATIFKDLLKGCLTIFFAKILIKVSRPYKEIKDHFRFVKYIIEVLRYLKIL